MLHISLKSIMPVTALLLICFVSESAVASDSTCEALRSDLEKKKGRLSEYLAVTRTLGDGGDPEIIGAVGLKISQLKAEIVELEREIGKCGDNKGRTVNSGLSAVKSEEGDYAVKSCGEMRKRLVHLVKVVHNLKRREKSMLSELTPVEKTELAEASEELKVVREALRTRCSSQPTPKPFRRDAKPPPRQQ